MKEGKHHQQHFSKILIHSSLGVAHFFWWYTLHWNYRLNTMSDKTFCKCWAPVWYIKCENFLSIFLSPTIMSLTNLSFQKRISRLHHQSRSHREGGARAASRGHTPEASAQNLRYEGFQHPRWGTFLSLMHASSLLTLSQSFQLLEELAGLSIIHSNYVSIHFSLYFVLLQYDDNHRHQSTLGS